MPTLEGKFGCVLGSPKKRDDYFIYLKKLDLYIILGRGYGGTWVPPLGSPLSKNMK